MSRRGRSGGGAAGARAALAAVLASTALLTGCAQSVDPIERLGRRAAEEVRPPRPHAERAYRRWGLAAPLAAPPSHPARPRPGRAAADTALPRVVDRVPTADRVVFLTYDDGAERDPRFADMVRELGLPVSFFLTGSAAGPGHGRFARLRAAGAGLQNRTLHHPALPALPYSGQRAEICGQQDRLRSRLGARPRLLRPPHGAYDGTTLRAAADCALSALVLHRATLTGAGLTYTRGPRHLCPGDVVLVDPGGPAAPGPRARTIRLLRMLQRAGLTVARLEDYL
ncbi:polysaccharide deacetylase family protein [Streptomyces sp. TG1A-8]|uniref:polysaccharide deacetylase family protein n=1 Tax=Streptomyces sp. TG1A-8 TaxID=3051385 RepID=UPI00265C479D|nr:polysaccharide deacetylase family protein [Streptomyces sp. TG1A-8]MDO0926184.1 polysaccharide deacetylase family protein [Streptomyces sp. TG1A-8]